MRGLPTSTYRLQIWAGFTLEDATELVGYLKELGVGWIYLSPILRAEPGSQHGYDVIDHSMVDPERGGPEAFDRLASAAHNAGLGVVVDIVPNHMGIATPRLNRWWWDVLEHGQSSAFARAFDIDWAAGNGRILVPVLAENPDGEAAELERLTLEGDTLHYGDQVFPIAPGTASAGDSPSQVHRRQHYELVVWTRADSDLNYRRFFAVNTLAALRIEDPWVFDAAHGEVARWFRDGLADGLRVDHPDGLADPGSYLESLARITDGAPVWVEKILEGDEPLPAGWATAGTTGYDALADVDRIFVNPAAESSFSAIDAMLGAEAPTWPDLIVARKRAIAAGLLGSEVNRLARLVPTLPNATDAIGELLAQLPIYRTYLPGGADELAAARDAAADRRPDLRAALDALTEALLVPGTEPSVRFEQTSPAVMAKAVEDNAFYRRALLSSLNEVGGNPAEFAISQDEFDRRQRRRFEFWPASLTTLSTHDTKRAEDTRARIAALSEHPDLWIATLTELHRIIDLGDGGLEHQLWEAVIGSWPATRERLQGYALKAARESGVSTTWARPDSEFEERLAAAVDAVFDDERVTALLSATVRRVAAAGWSNSLGAKLVQLTAPGIPDLYQGTELWDGSLVDPDNRRPVDFTAREALLRRIDDGWRPPVDESGAAKLLVVSRALRLRHAHPERFTAYEPVLPSGERAGHVIAFDRGGAVTIATRLPAALADAGGWGDTAVQLPRDATDLLTGARFAAGLTAVSRLLERYPVALLTEPD